MLQKKLLYAAAVIGMIGTTSLPAATIATGTFNMSGIVTVSNTTMSFVTDATGNAANMFTLSGGTGSFTIENGQNAIENLNISTQTVGGAGFTPSDFINFLVNASLPNLNIDYIAPGLYTAAGCAAPVAAGDTCTPPANGGQGLFNFVDNPPGGASSSATWVFEGVEAGAPNVSWTAIFTSQFTVPYQTVLAQLSSVGSVTNSYSGSVTVFVTPEPSPLMMLGIGLGLLALWGAGAARRRNRNPVAKG